MKKSEYINHLSNSINDMFNSVGDKTLIGEMFSDKATGPFQKQDFISFLKSPYLVKFSGSWNGLSDKNGNRINLERFYDEAALSLLHYFKDKKFTKEKTFEDCFSYESETEPRYFDELATVVTNTLEKHGMPPLFHKRQDKVLRHEWEKEDK